MTSYLGYALLALLCLFSSRAESQVTPAELVVLEAEKDVGFNATDRVINLSQAAASSLTNGNGLIRIDPYNNFPPLVGSGISGGYSTLSTCITYPPHTHLRALEFIYVVQGTLTLTVVGELNAGQQSMTYTVPTGGITYVPRAHVHTESNLGCGTLVFLSTLTSEDPGTQFFPSALLVLPSNILSASFGGNQTAQANIMAALSAVTPSPNPFATVPSCGQTCPGTAPAASLGR